MTTLGRNPVYDGYLADPFVWRDPDGSYYAIGTGALEAAAAASPRRPVFPLLVSRDLLNWRLAGHALESPAPELGDAYWAPEIARMGDRYYLYYSVGFGDKHHQLRVAVSEAPVGPYVDVRALTTLGECAFAIDPHPFRDEDGQWYLFQARDFLDAGEDELGSFYAGTALVVSPLRSPTELDPECRVVARARAPWQCFARQRSIYGHTLDWFTLEGPCVVRHEGVYYCLFSGGCWQNDTYGVDWVTADHPLGPYSLAEAPLPRLLRTGPCLSGPGHCSVFQTHAGESMLAYHAWDAGRVLRQLCLSRLSFCPGGPRLADTEERS
jgi:beta-xylosidase